MPNRKHILLVGILLSQLALFGCSKGDSSDSYQQDAQPHYIDTTGSDQAKQTALSGQVSCASSDAADCSPSVGMLVALTPPTSVSQCTAFLVTPQIAITNSHCIPADLKAAGSSCSDRIWIYFPDVNGYPQLRSGCSQVLTASTLPETTKAVPDYAVIRLDQQVNRPPLTISRDGFKDQGEYRIVKIDPQSTTSAIGVMTRTICKAQHNSIIAPNSNDDKSANMAMGDCQILHGNSGSPLLDTQGQVHGVIQLTFEESTLGAALLQFTLPMLDGSSIGTLSAGTSFACLNLPAEAQGAPLAPQCAAVVSSPDAKQAETKVLLGKIGNALETELNQISGELNPAFQWSVAKYDNTGLLAGGSSYTQQIIPVPSCIKDSKSLLDGHHGWLGGYDSKAGLSLALPKLAVKMGVNRYLVPDYRIDGSEGFVSTSLSYSPSDIAKKNSSQFTLTEPGIFGASHSLFSQSLGLCKKATQ